MIPLNWSQKVQSLYRSIRYKSRISQSTITKKKIIETERETDIEDGERDEPWKKDSFFINREFTNPLKLFVPFNDTIAAKSTFLREIPYDGAFESNRFGSFPFDLNDMSLPRSSHSLTLITNGIIIIAVGIQTFQFVNDYDDVEFDGEERRPRRPPHDLFHFHHHTNTVDRRKRKEKIG